LEYRVEKNKNKMIENLIKDLFENFEPEVTPEIWTGIQNVIN
jgi:hypothetical protein